MNYNYIVDIDYPKYGKNCIDFLQRLIQTPSVNGKDSERAVVDLISSEASKLNLPYQIVANNPDHPNILIGNNIDSNNNLLLVAHTDTVGIGDESRWDNKPFSGEIQDGKIYGRGAIDCKGGVALNLYVLKILTDIGRPNLVKVAAVADEEIAGDSDFGLRYMLTEGLSAKAAIYTYGGSSGHNAINIGHRGVLRLWITCHGQGAHSGSKEWQDGLKGSSAIEGIIAFVHKLQSLNFCQINPYFPGYKTVITPTLIQGGSGESLVPDTAKVFLDIRLLPDTPSDSILKLINEIISSLTTDIRKYEISIKNNVPAALSDPTHPFIDSLIKINKSEFGIDPTIKGSGPMNESYMLINKGIPTVAGFGPSGDNFHAPNEYANLDSFAESLRILTIIAQEVAVQREN
jgi:acetylornithine deacetylase/succinyl-diaminopimelate desuccinylase-like protein